MANDRLNFGIDLAAGVCKKIIYPGKGELPEFPNDTKVEFHYQTRKCNDEKTVLEDSKKEGKSMELYIGKKFKLEIWETCIKSMRRNEVASFAVDPKHLGTYPIVCKSLREYREGLKSNKPKEHTSSHCCGLQMKEHGLGHKDLDGLMANPEPLEFIIEILNIEEPGNYTKDTWAMSHEEKEEAVPKLKEEGNKLYKEQSYKEAAEKYSMALGFLEQLELREKPGDTIHQQIQETKVPLLLNYSQCKLLMKEYYPAIEHTTEVLKIQPDNVKALFRRAKAHVGAWNLTDAKQDFEKVSELDSSLAKAVQKELLNISELGKSKDIDDKNRFKGKLFG